MDAGRCRQCGSCEESGERRTARCDGQMHSEGNGTIALGRILLVLFAMLALAGCARQSSDAIGHAYVAPEKLNLRRELTQKNSTSAVLNYGDPVDIVDVRRRFVKV